MAAMDFPASPTVGQKYPVPAVAGLPQYTWDGEKWTTVGGSIWTAVPGDALPLPNALPAVVGVATKYAREDHVHPSDTSRAPLSGIQINGAFDVSQELGTAGITAAGYVCDGWRFAKAGAAVLSVRQTATPGLFAGQPNFLIATVTTAQLSLAAGEYGVISQPVEGYRIARLDWGRATAQSITLCFSTAHVRTGIYSGTIRNASSDRSYPFTYTQNVSGVPEYKTVVIPGDTQGAWAIDNTVGMSVTFAMAAGSTYTAPTAGSWVAGNYLAAPGQVNAVGLTSDIFRLSGVVILPGVQAPTAAQVPFILRPYDQELLICKRYFYNGVPPVRGLVGSANGLSRLACLHPVAMRTVPILTMTSPLPVYEGNVVTTINSIGANECTATALEFEATSAAAMTAGRPAMVYQGGGGNLNVDARL
jgi:hypothetical protein